MQPPHDEAPPFKYYVALDLGSESTAAYYEEVKTRQGGMVDLQHYAYELRGDAVQLDLLTEPGGPEGKRRSPRLRTQFGLRGSRQPKPLPTEHAALDFVDPHGQPVAAERLPGEEGLSRLHYEDSVFEFFRAEREVYGGDADNMPNPKIPFQRGGAAVIPKIQIKNSPALDAYTPRELIQHMTVQVLRNFVLRSPQLRNVRPEEIHLTLTVPNVYSLAHAEAIKTFVQEHAGLRPDAVEVLYESDAVAYTLLDVGRSRRDPAYRAIRERLSEAKESYRLLTFDVGRGTTDLSLIGIETRPDAEGRPELWHHVLARTGRSTGGNRLSYLLARYYNDRLQAMRPWFENHAGAEIPFDFFTGTVRGRPFAQQGPALEALLHLTETVKRNLTADYALTLSAEDQRALIDPVVVFIFSALGEGWEGANQAFADDVRQKIYEAWVLPPRLPRPSWWQRLLGRLARHTPTAPERLARDIDAYVQEIVALLEELEDIARSRSPEAAEAFDPRHTVVLVAGQASQFGPLRRAIERACRRVYRLDVYFLEGNDAKEACCQGAVLYQRTNTRHQNPEALFGSFGFIPVGQAPGAKLFNRVDMERISRTGSETVEVEHEMDYVLVYSTHPHLDDDIDPSDESLAAVSVVRPRAGKSADGRPTYQFEIRYDPRVPEVRVNGEVMHDVGTFGDLGDQDAIYAKVWPDVLKPKA